MPMAASHGGTKPSAANGHGAQVVDQRPSGDSARHLLHLPGDRAGADQAVQTSIQQQQVGMRLGQIGAAGQHRRDVGAGQ